MSHYVTLGINKDATEKEIKAAFKNLALMHHPDRGGNAEQFKKVHEAYEVLSDKLKRAEYDKFGAVNNKKRRPPPPPQDFKPPPNFRNIFEDIFDNGGRGRNVQILVEIELKDILTGVTKQVNIAQIVRCYTCLGRGFTEVKICVHCSGTGGKTVQQNPFHIFLKCAACEGTGKAIGDPCPECRGEKFIKTGEKFVGVNIPPGIDNTTQIRLMGEGEPGPKRNGDAIITVVMKEHHLYKRQGVDIMVDIPVSYTQLVLGDKVTLPGLDEVKIDFDIPPGTQSDTRFRIKGRGLPYLGGADRGDLVAIVKIEVPKDVKYKDILTKLAKHEKDNITPKREKFENHCT